MRAVGAASHEHATLARDLRALADGTFDLLIAGGGIHGLAIAADAAGRGLRVALVERGDYGSAASFNHQKTAHGGLRSLQTGDLRKARESIVERRTLARIAPRLLRPLPFLIATTRSLTRNPLALAVAFAIDRTLGRDRNEGVEPELQLPPPRLVSRTAARKLFRRADGSGLSGGAMWYDYQILETERLTLGFALSAAARGAVLCNYVEALGPLRANDRIAGLRVRDVLTGEALEVRATLTLNAAGAHAGTLMKTFGSGRSFPLVRAMNVVTSRPGGEIALASPTADGRMLTMTPWRDLAVIGTSQSPRFLDATAPDADAGDLASFLNDIPQAFPAFNITPADVMLVHRGIVPAERDRRGRPMLKRHPDIIDHSREGAPGAMTVVGVKYTTARGVAERAVDAAMRALGRARGRSRTADEMLPGAAIADYEALSIEAERRAAVTLDSPSRARLAFLYGGRLEDVLSIAGGNQELARRLAAGTAAIGAEVAHAIRRESALHLDDIILRRMTIGSSGWPGDEVVLAAARIAAAELNWNDARVNDEIARLRDRYRVLT